MFIFMTLLYPVIIYKICTAEQRTYCIAAKRLFLVVSSKSSIYHSCLPSPLAPDPIRVQSCVCCLFWTNRNSMAVISSLLSNIYLSIYIIIKLEIWILQSALTVNWKIYFTLNFNQVQGFNLLIVWFSNLEIRNWIKYSILSFENSEIKSILLNHFQSLSLAIN